MEDELNDRIDELEAELVRCDVAWAKERAEISSLRAKVERYKPFVLVFRDLLDSCEDVLWCADIDGGTFQDVATKHKVLVEGPCRTQQERDEWGEDATMYYLSDDATAALADNGKG